MPDKPKGTGYRLFGMEIKRVPRPTLGAHENVIEFTCPKCHATLEKVQCRCPMYHYRCLKCNTFYTLELYEKPK